MIDTHISRELTPYDAHMVRNLLNNHGYVQVLALKFRIGQTVNEKRWADYPFVIKYIGMDDNGEIIYYGSDGGAYNDSELEAAT